MFSCKATQRSTQALSAARGACATERFTGAHPPSSAGPLSDYKVAVDASVRRRSGRMCRRKVHWRSSFPAELGPFRLHGRGWPCLSAATRAAGLSETVICSLRETTVLPLPHNGASPARGRSCALRRCKSRVMGSGY